MSALITSACPEVILIRIGYEAATKLAKSPEALRELKQTLSKKPGSNPIAADPGAYEFIFENGKMKLLKMDFAKLPQKLLVEPAPKIKGEHRRT